MKILRSTPLVAALAALFLAAPTFGANLRVDDDDKDKDKKEAEADEDDDEDKDRYFAVVGADVYTGRGGVLRRATVLSKNGVIEEIGYDIDLPEATEVLHARGMRVYPGLVAIQSSGLFGGTSDLGNTVNPYNSNMILALGGGITSAGQSNQAAKLKRGEIENVVMNSKMFTNFSFSKTSPKTKRDLRAKFAAASKYLRDYRQWQLDVKKDKELKEPKSSGIDKNVTAVLKGEALAKFSARERTDLLEIARLAQEYGFRPVIDGCAEGWTVADELGRAGAYAIVTPRYRRSKSENQVHDAGSSIENAAILHKAGVQVAIIPAATNIDLGGIVGRDIMHLPIEAGFAIRGGMSEQAAMEAITIIPARLMGIDHRVGTIEVGKDCDLIVCDGDVLHYQTFVQWAVVDGKVAYDKEEELYFAHIRPRDESMLAPEVNIDAGESPTVITGDPEVVEESGDETPEED